MLPPRFRRPRFLIVAAAIAVALVGVPSGIYFVTRTPATPSMAFSEFLQQVERGGIAKVTFGERAIDAVLRDGRTVQTVAPPEFLSANSSFITNLVRRDVRVEVTPVTDPQAPFTVLRADEGRIGAEAPRRLQQAPSRRGQATCDDREAAGEAEETAVS